MANNIDKKEPVAIYDQSKIDVTKCDNHELAGNIEPLIKVILKSATIIQYTIKGRFMSR